MSTLDRIHLQGFKGFGETTSVPLAPLTLLLGANSIGKSSITQAVLALAQSVASGLPLPERLACRGRYVDLGCYENALNKAVEDGRMTLGVRWSDGREVMLRFRGEEGGPGRLETVGLGSGGEMWWLRATALPDDRATVEMKLVGSGRGLPDHLVRRTDALGLGPLMRSGRALVVMRLVRGVLTCELEPASAQDLADSGQDPLSDQELALLQELPADSEDSALTIAPQLRRYAEGHLGLLAELLGDLLPVGPGRVFGQRIEPVDEETLDRWVGFAGERMFQVLWDQEEQVLGLVNQWLGDLEIPYKLEVDRSQGQTGPVVELTLQSLDPERPHRVGIPDVGFGVGQILPVLVQLAVARRHGGLVTIEQPEIHLHPKLQAGLADILVEVVTPPPPAPGELERQEHDACQVVVETHSEHLVLGVQRAVKRGRIGRDDVALVALSKETGHPEATRIRLDEEGDMLDRWPGGFFPERFALMRDLR